MGDRSVEVELDVRTRYRPWPGHQTQRHTLQVRYGDPDYVELPDGQGSLLLRSRIMKSAEDQTMGATPGNSISDVVAWWSPDDRFDHSGVRGPFLLVDGLQARPGLQVRSWLGVPAAVVDDGDLYVYYASEATDPPFLDSAQGADLEGFEGGIAAKRIKLSRLLQEVESAGPAGTLDPTSWSHKDAVPGKLLGPIRVWAAIAGKEDGHVVEPLITRVPGDNKVVDPDPVRCEAGLQLFLTLLPEGPINQRAGKYHGLWHTTALPKGTRLTVGGVTMRTTPGRDFIVAPVDSEGSADLLSPAPSASHPLSQVFLDPDAVRLPDGSWLVYGGSSDSSGLWRFSGTDAEACAAWDQAWDR